MTAPTEVKVPDIGDFGTVPIIEVHVSAGDQVNAEDPLVTLESDKATMDVPAPVAGSVAEVLVKVGDEVSEGSPILLLTPGDGAVTTPPSLVEQQEPAPAPAAAPPARAALGPGGGWSRHPRRDTRRALGAAHRPGVGRGPGRGDPNRAQGPHHQGRPAAVRQGPGPTRRRPSRRDRRRGSRRSPRRTSPRSGPSTPRRSHGSRQSPDPSCTAPGSTSPTSRTTTKPTSPTSTTTAKNSTPPPRTTATPTG